jgi:hypothetical protein
MSEPRCGHRKLRIRTIGEKVRARCMKCGAEGADHDSITVAFIAYRSDLKDAEALRAATAAKKTEATRAHR